MIQINMEKPTHCLRCPMLNSDAECVLIQEIDTSWDWEELYANCPLQEVKSERKKGKWIYKNDLQQFFCSECGFPSLTYDDTYIYGMDLPNYCEDCGADMRGEE